MRLLLSQLKLEEDLSNLPFNHLIKTDQTDSSTYLIKDNQEIIGFINLKNVGQNLMKLDKFVICKPDHSEQIIEVFYHILELVEKEDVDHLLIETDQESLVELLNWLGFKRWSEAHHTYGYPYP